MGKEVVKRLPARLDYLYEFMDFIAQFVKGEGFPETRISEVELIAEEMLVNIFSYAYPEKEGEVEVRCTPGSDDSVILQFIDCGIPFDLLSISAPDVNASIEERKVGGLGIFLVRKLATDIAYRREDGQNVLSVTISQRP